MCELVAAQLVASSDEYALHTHAHTHTHTTHTHIHIQTKIASNT